MLRKIWVWEIVAGVTDTNSIKRVYVPEETQSDRVTVN